MKHKIALKTYRDYARPFTRRQRRAWAKLTSRTEAYEAVQAAHAASKESD